MVTKTEYVLDGIKRYLQYCEDENRDVDLHLLDRLIRQWEFDYEMENRIYTYTESE